MGSLLICGCIKHFHSIHVCQEGMAAISSLAVVSEIVGSNQPLCINAMDKAA